MSEDAFVGSVLYFGSSSRAEWGFFFFFFFQAEDGIRDFCLSRGLGVAGTTKLSQLAGKSIDVVLASNAGKTYTFTLSFVNETTEA